MTPHPQPEPALAPEDRVHLIGIGGSGMSAVAQLLCERGLTVSGSDLQDGPATQALRRIGARVTIGHRGDLVAGADLVVISNAVPDDNVELVAARRTGVPVVLRADVLEWLMAGHRRVLVSGTHGKTTTTAMTTVALKACGLDPSYAIGGSLPGDTGAHHGQGGVFVAEADEAFRSFLRLTADIAVVTNLEMDHHDEYRDLTAYREAFLAFLDRRPPGGPALLCADDPGSAGLLDEVRPPVLTYGTGNDADIVIGPIATGPSGEQRFTLAGLDGPIGTVNLAVPGRHNALNAAAAVVASREAGGDITTAIAGLAGFTGALRRFQTRGSAGGVVVIDDYGHHPTEVAATLDAARQANPAGRVVVVFQPHRYTRTQALGADLGTALAAADLVVVTAVYAAGEPPIPGVDGHTVADAAARAGAEVRAVPANEDLAAVVAGLSRPGDLLLTLGAGDITLAGPRILALLEGRP